ncbi:WG repeat-containing protein [Hymenobacter koreensis]|uniref:WG repeat-containing protein n=1 Tax=Hymenobacter koreensis TaxID=1084523 RepID=A0ABP8JKU9_9BACT
MLHQILFAPFPDTARQQLYEQVRATLRDDASAPATLLLGNFAVEEGGETMDAVVIRPHSITLLVFVPGGGRLSIPSLTYGAWKLDAQTVRGAVTGADNPFEQFRHQKDALAAWLAPQLSAEQANLQFISGVVVFGAPVTFSPDVEEALGQQPGSNFQLLADATQLPRRLKQLARPEIDLTDDELAQWARDLADEPEPVASPAMPMAQAAAAAASPASEPEEENSLWRRAWRWLGAEDIPDDTPYGGYPAAQVAASSAEKERLERIRQDSQAELRQQLQALETREAQRERNMAELRAQLAQAAPVTTEAQELRERLAAESREKAALDEAMRASRAESETRNRELDAKIQQLGQLVEQLNARAASPSPSPGASPAAAPASGLPGVLAYRNLRVWRKRLPRVATVVGAVGLLGLGAWGLSHLGSGTPKPYQENGKWGFADASGKPVVAPKYSSVREFQQEQAVVEQNGAYGLVDESGQEVVPPAYDALNPYAGGYARVRVGDAYTFLDEQGKEFDNYYFNALDFSEGYAAVLDHRGWYYINGPEPEDPAKPPVVFREAYPFREGLARVRLADGYTYVTQDYLTDPSKGTEPFGRYEQATDFDQGKALVTQNGRRFTIDTDGDPVD